MNITDNAEIDNIPLTFGMYKNYTPTELVDFNPSYVVWLYENVKPAPCSEKLARVCRWKKREMQAEGDFATMQDEPYWYFEEPH